MTHLGTIIIILVCMGLGYIIEPMFVSGVKKKPATQAANKPEADDSEDPSANTPEKPADEPTIQVDLSKITQADFPEKVALKVDYTVSDAESGATVKLPKGSMVKPVRLEGSQLVIQPSLIPIQSSISVDKTNFKELALPKMLERLKNPVANNDPQPTPPADPDPTPPAPDPAPDPDPDPAPVAASKLDEAAIVALLKKDVAAGKVTEFKADQVTAWKGGEDTEFDGSTYQTGRVTFKAETILGVQEHEAIALIEDGKVYKWMWAKTKLEMR
ncbi:MAG: hypothetical protein AB8F34_14260 [Akkermansiaceae bacterium]